MPRNPSLRAELQIWRDLSRALDAWDRFDHRQALGIIEHYNQRIGPEQPQLLVTLRDLTDTQRAERREALQLFDLWRNAQRRAVQGCYDDAVARVYRLLELGLFQAWRLAGTIPGPAAAFVEAQLTRLQDHVQVRNHSILAHGYEPINAAEWTRLADWLQTSFLPLLESEAATVGVGVRTMPEQLPVGCCWAVA